MENPKDIKKPKEETAEVLEETAEEVGGEKVEKAEGFRNQFEGNDERIEENLNGNDSPEAKKIRGEEEGVMNKAGEKISGFENEVENTDNKEKAEREKLLEEVFENSVGGIMTSFHDTGQVYKTYGEKIGYKKGFIINQFPVEDKEFKQNGINEAVTISPMSTEVYDEEEYTEGTIFKKKKKRRVETGRRDMNFDEMKKGGKNEKAYRFVYKTIDDEKAIYRDSSGRCGQYMFVELYLPESIALEILEEIKSEPKFAREIVEKLVKEKMKQDEWDGGENKTPLRPPYEKWAENKGGESKMYVQEPDVKERGLNKDWIVDVEKGKPQEDVIKTESVEPKTDAEKEAKPEPNPETETPETEKTAEEIENEEMADKIAREVNEEKLDEETKERLGKWDKEENKDQKIGEEKDNIKEKLGNRLMEREKEKAEEIERAKERGEVVETEDGARLINQESVKKILESRDKLAKLRDELGKEAEDGAKERKRIAEGIKTSIDPNNPELAKLNIGEQMMAKEAVSRFLKTTKDILSLNEIDYLLEAEKVDFGNLSQTHEKRKIEMEELQEIIDAIEEYKKFMEEFEKKTEEQKEEAREEVGRFVRQLDQIKKKNKKLFVALGIIIVGVAILVSTVGLPAGMSVPAYLALKNVAIATGSLAIGGVAIYHRKKIGSLLKNVAGASLGAAIGAGVVFDAMLNGKKWDSWMESICGTSIPKWARSKDDKK